MASVSASSAAENTTIVEQPPTPVVPVRPAAANTEPSETETSKWTTIRDAIMWVGLMDSEHKITPEVQSLLDLWGYEVLADIRDLGMVPAGEVEDELAIWTIVVDDRNVKPKMAIRAKARLLAKACRIACGTQKRASQAPEPVPQTAIVAHGNADPQTLATLSASVQLLEQIAKRQENNKKVKFKEWCDPTSTQEINIISDSFADKAYKHYMEICKTMPPANCEPTRE